MSTLEDLARDLVGDGKQPNLFFVTGSELEVLAIVTTRKRDAIAVAQLLGAAHVEDRHEGMVWER